MKSPACMRVPVQPGGAAGSRECQNRSACQAGELMVIRADEVVKQNTAIRQSARSRIGPRGDSPAAKRLLVAVVCWSDWCGTVGLRLGRCVRFVTVGPLLLWRCFRFTTFGLLLLGRRARYRNRLRIEDYLAYLFGRYIRLLGFRVNRDENHLQLTLDIVDDSIAAAFALPSVRIIRSNLEDFVTAPGLPDRPVCRPSLTDRLSHCSGGFQPPFRNWRGGWKPPLRMPSRLS